MSRPVWTGLWMVGIQIEEVVLPQERGCPKQGGSNQ